MFDERRVIGKSLRIGLKNAAKILNTLNVLGENKKVADLRVLV